MSNLDKHLVNKEQELSTLELSIRQLQEQLNQINQEIRVEKQLAQAQKSIEKEFNGVKEKLFKLFKDACECFSVDALDDMGNDLLEIVEQVKSEYESYAVSDRFLNAETAAIEDEEEVNTLSTPFLSGAVDAITFSRNLAKEVQEEIKAEQEKRKALKASMKTFAQVAKEFNLSERVAREYLSGKRIPEVPSVHYTRWQLILEKYDYVPEFKRWKEKE